MYILGVETSCDETSLSIVLKRKVLSNITWSSLRYHAKFGGVIPEIASREHLKSIGFVFEAAQKEAKISKNKIGLISVVSHPGLIGSLLVGVNFARALGCALNIPVVEVNHLYAHLFAGFLNNKAGIGIPSLGLVVSGGHTEMYLMQGFGDIQVLGRTRDDAAGEALDKIGRLFGLGYPAGPEIDKIFNLGLVDKNLFKVKGMQNNLDFSFSGIKTKAGYIYKQHKGRIRLKDKAGILSSFQYGVVSHIIDKLELALSKYRPKCIICGGGVVANSFLRSSLVNLCKQRKVSLTLPESIYCSDNGAAVAGLGFYVYNKKVRNNNITGI